MRQAGKTQAALDASEGVAVGRRASDKVVVVLLVQHRGVPEVGANCVRLCFKDGGRFGVFFADHCGNPRLKNPCLFPGNGRTGVPQILLVVQANARDHAHFRMDHVGAVQPTAQADLDHRHVHLGNRKVP